MANLVTGATGILVPKLYELLKEEYGLQKRVKKRISSLTEELEGAQAALCEVAELPWDQVDEQVQVWTREVREASYDMEDVLDTFLVRVQGPDSPEQEKSLLKHLNKMVNFFKTYKVRRKISRDVEGIMTRLQEVTERCRRYKVHDIVDRLAKSSPVDPRLHAMYNKVQDLVGIDESRGELISNLQPLQRDDASNLKMKIVSIVGVGGLGKTTLAKAVYDELKGDFNCGAFVPVGRNPDLKKVLKDILMDLVDKQRRLELSAAVLDERQLIDDLRSFLKNKRYFIVIDDIWEIPSWETIKLAIDDDNNCGAKIVITTRKQEVAEKADEVYKLRPLPDDISRELFFIRIGGHEGKLVDSKPDEVTLKFLKKCAGIPLAIITMASLLADKPREKWDELYRAIGFQSEDNDQAQNTMRIVSFSYYDLPVHIRTCLLYLSAFPEDFVIPKYSLVWMWVAEGFVKKKQGMRLFETGEGYFHDLINRSMLEAVKSEDDDSIVTGCRVHDMVLDFIRSMSHQENFFSVVFGNDQDTLLESKNVPRRLARHDRTMGHGHRQGDDLKMEKVRSLFAIGCGIEALDPFHGFTLLRVLVIDNNWKATKDYFVFRSEHVRHLLHLRFLSIRGTFVKRVPEEIERLRFLQMLDLNGSSLEECPSPESLPEQLVRLCLPSYKFDHSNDGITWLTKLTALEELSLTTLGKASWRLPTEIRVLQLRILDRTDTTVRDFWERVRHLNKLEHLTISSHLSHAKVSVLPSSLRYFALDGAISRGCKLPSCINASCLPNLSHLEMKLGDLDEHDLKMLGMLPELRFLRLTLLGFIGVGTVVVVSDKDAAEVYFPRLRCCSLNGAMVSCYANKEDKSISFYVWNGKDGFTMPSVSVDKPQRPIISCSTGGGRASTSATGGGAPCNRFMPCLEVLRIICGAFTASNWDDYNPGLDEYAFPSIHGVGIDHGEFIAPDRYNLSLEYAFPSLREIGARTEDYEIRAALWSAAKAHPNRPVFRWL